MSPSATLSDLREAIPVLQERTYLFAGAMAPLADPVAAELGAWRRMWEEDPMGAFNHHTADGNRLRRAFAALIGASSEEIAILSSTSEGSNRVIGMLSASRRRTVLVDDTTFPTMIYPWLTKTDKEIEYVPSGRLSNGDWLERRLKKGDVLAVAVSHVGNTNGIRHDLTALSTATQPNDVLLLVDAAQSTGAIPIAVEAMGVDILTTTSLKWLLGPPGIGLLYVREGLQRDLPLSDVGYLQARVEGNVWPRVEVPDYPSVAASLELGIPAIPGLAAAAAGIELLLSVGVEAIEERVDDLMSLAIPALEDRGFEVVTPRPSRERAGVISARHPRSEELAGFLANRRIDIGGFPGGTVRVDPHGYNTTADIETMLAAIDDFTRTQ